MVIFDYKARLIKRFPKGNVAVTISSYAVEAYAEINRTNQTLMNSTCLSRTLNPVDSHQFEDPPIQIQQMTEVPLLTIISINLNRLYLNLKLAILMESIMFTQLQ